MAQLRPSTLTEGSKVFIFSGLSDSDRKDLAKKVSQLGAKYLDLKDFKTFCTHVVTIKLTKSEKVLGALATGKWILHPDYIRHSATAGCWLDEEQYEFCDESIMRKCPTADVELSYAPRRWRFLLGGQSSAFTGWKVAVVAGAKKAVVIKRLLVSGGAEVYNLKLPVTHPEKVADTIGYVFVSEQNIASVTSLYEYGVLCLKPEYIGDFLIKDPQPDISDYLVNPLAVTPPAAADSILIQDQSHDVSFLAMSQTSSLSQSSSSIHETDHPTGSNIAVSPLVNPHQVTRYKSVNSPQITKPFISRSKQMSASIKLEKTENIVGKASSSGESDPIVIDLTEPDPQEISIISVPEDPMVLNKSVTLDNRPTANVTSPITNFFKPLFPHKVEKELDMKEEVEKALATSTPVHSKTVSKVKELENKSRENGTVHHGEKRKMGARKRLTANSIPPVKVHVSGDNEKDKKIPCASDCSTTNNFAPSGDGMSASNNTSGTSASQEHKAATKRKGSHLTEVLLDLKRQKLSPCGWLPLTYSYNQRENEIKGDSLFLNVASAEIIHSMLEEGATMPALTDLQNRVSIRYVPVARTLHTLLFTVLQNAETDMEANLAYEVFIKALRLHPPITDSLQKLYLDVLSPKTDDENVIGVEWTLILELIYSIIQEEVQKKRNCFLMFKIIKYMIQQNLHHYLLNKSDNPTDQFNKHMLLKIMWCPSYHVTFNARCRQLLDAMHETVRLYKMEKDSLKKETLHDFLEDLMWLIAMVTESCQKEECGSVGGINCLNAHQTSIFIHEISKRLTDADITDSRLFHRILSMLRLPWLRVGVCQQILNTLDDYLITDEPLGDFRLLTLTLLVRRYIFLLPRNHIRENETPIPKSVRQKKELLQQRKNNNKENHVENGKLLSKVNKRNPKGETQLHVACIKNDVVSLKNLLKIPGIDVNIADYAGWTPLHEACYHGNIECVQELLKFVPSKTMESFFNDGMKPVKKADLLAVNTEGITPLHEAVLNERLEVCRFLLQHGGSRLLKAQTCLGYTALELANTEEMYQVLCSALPNNRDRCDSQDSSLIDSQGSLSSSEDYRNIELPSDLLYNKVLYSAGKRLYTNSNSLLQYLHMIIIVLNNYIQATNLLTVSDKLKAKKIEKISNMSVPSQSDSKVCVTPNENESNEKGSNKKISSQELKTVKRDLRVLRRLPNYLELFKSHLLKLCHPDDCDVIKKDWVALQMLVDNIHVA